MTRPRVEMAAVRATDVGADINEPWFSFIKNDPRNKTAADDLDILPRIGLGDRGEGDEP